jgi:beta-glucosidase-like glycosyl hydrolase
MTGKLRPKDVDECVLRILRVVKEAKASGIPFELEEQVPPTSQATQDLLRESAQAATVLLKNDINTLPVKLTSGLRIAVVGPHAKPAFICKCSALPVGSVGTKTDFPW